MKIAVRSPYLNLVISGLNKPIPLSFLSHVNCLSHLIILVTFQWTHCNMSCLFYPEKGEPGSRTPSTASQERLKRASPWFSFGGWNCLQANSWNEGLSIRVFKQAGSVNTSLFQSKGLCRTAEHHNQENLAQSFADGARGWIGRSLFFSHSSTGFAVLTKVKSSASKQMRAGCVRGWY